tara:strand:- start:2869 stop:3210 length:342 start_codon:yes stop_codon:yes gene_type:complete
MTKQEKKLTKALLKEVQRITKHLLRSKSTMLPLSEIQINLLDEDGDGAALYVTAAIDEETGEIELERGFEDISRGMDIEVELEDHGDYDFNEDELDDMWKDALRTNSSRRLLN